MPAHAGAVPSPPTERTAPGAARRALDLTGWVLTAAFVVAWLLVLRPAGLGGPATLGLVQGQSMEPGMRTGDLFVARRQDVYRRGDVVVFRIPGTGPEAGRRVVHRIVGGSAAAGFTTQGDNRVAPDFWRPTPRDIDGAVWLAVPRVGTLVGTLRSDVGIAAFAALLAFSVAGEPWRPARRRGRDEPA